MAALASGSGFGGALGLIPVEVVGEFPRAGDGDRAFRLITRSGHRIEGLRLVDVIEIVRVLLARPDHARETA